MKAVDTNVLARVILGDDQSQAATATSILQEPIWVPITVWLELGWVLGRRLRMHRSAMADALEALLTSATVHTDDSEGLLWAVDRLRTGADWADMIHLISARGTAEAFVTFDQDVRNDAGPSTPLPIETLA